MGISPWAKGQTSPTWTIICERDNDEPMILTGVLTSQLSLAIYSSNYAPVATGGGSFTIISVGDLASKTPAVVNYAPVAADSATTGTFYVRIIVDYNGTSPDMSDYIRWEIDP